MVLIEVCAVWHQNWGQVGVDVCTNGHSECHNNTEKTHLYAILMLLVHLSSC